MASDRWLLLGLLCAACGSEGAAATRPAPAEHRTDARPPVASVREATGDVRWQSASEPAWRAARPGVALHASDALQTMDEAAAAIRFEQTGAIARLGPGTTLRIPAQAPEVARLRHLSGRLVARLSADSDGRMEVELPPGTLVLEPPGRAAGEVEARVEVHEEQTEIAMLEGSARLERAHGGSLRVEEHRFVQVRSDGAVVEEGHLGARAEAVAPADGATLHTRRDVRFSWSPVAGADAVRLTIRTPSAITAHLDVPTTRTEAAVELPSGSFTWTVAGLVGGDPMPESPPRALVVDFDRAPPPLVVDSPRAGSTVAGTTARVAGRTEPDARLEVDGRAVAVAADGTFSAAIGVPRGLTNLVVVATDALGNARAVSRAVLRE